jgi:hypothetical protein
MSLCVHRSFAATVPCRVAPYRAIMAVDERARHELYEQAEAAMGRSSADTLMSLLPPVGWADVATKHDLSELEARLEARLDGRIGSLEARVDARFDGLERRMSQGEHRVLATMHQELTGVVLKMFALVVALVPALVVPLVTLR